MTSFSIDGLNVASVKPEALSLGLPLTDETLTINLTRTVSDRLTELQDFVAPRGGDAGPFVSLAAAVGGEVFRVTLNQDADTPIEHTLTRTPSAIIYSCALDGRAGQAVGSAVGGTPAPSDPINTTAWTPTTAFLRATRAGEYIVILA